MKLLQHSFQEIKPSTYPKHKKYATLKHNIGGLLETSLGYHVLLYIKIKIFIAHTCTC